MKWKVLLENRIRDDLAALGKTVGRLVLEELLARLQEDPLMESKNMKTMRPNPIASRQLKLFGRYRVLFDVDVDAHEVKVVLVGEKRGEKLFASGEEFTKHHENDHLD